MSVYDNSTTTATVECVNRTHYQGTWYEDSRNITVVDETHRRGEVASGDSKTPLPYWSCHTKNTFGILRSTQNYMAHPSSSQELIAPPRWYAYAYRDAFSNFPMAKPFLDNRLLERIGSTKLELGVELIEMRETADFVRDKTMYLLRNILDIRRGKIPRALKEKRIKRIWREKRRDRASRMLLEYRYALMPLMGSIEDSIKLIDEGFKRPDAQRLFSVAKASKTFKKPGYERVSTRSDKVITTTRSEGILMAHAKVYYTFSSVFLSDMKQLGASRGDVPQMIWEVLPFSFVVDMAIGVSAYLSRLTATQGLTFVSGYYAGKYQISGGDRVTTGEWNSSDLVTLRGSEAELTITSRDVLARWPTNTVEYENPLSLYNIATIAALAHQLKSGKAKSKYY
jgi:hypothetical protein